MANSIYSLGIYIGNSLSSLTTLIIDATGWRNAFYIIGITGILFTLLAIFLIKEPKRGKYDLTVGEKMKTTGKSLMKNYILAFKGIFENKITRYLIIAGCLRFWSGSTIGYLASKYFDVYSNDID